jgi:hypothetical protein
MEPVHNTLSEDIRTRTVELLNRRLAAAIDLHSRLKQAHWNVWRPTFIAVHPLSDKVAGEGENYSDLIAERAAGLRGIADGAVRSRRSALSSSPIPRASRTKTIRHSRSLRRSGRLGSRPATRSDSPRRSTAPIWPISSPKCCAASTIRCGSSNLMPRRIEPRGARCKGGAETFVGFCNISDHADIS